MWHGVMKILPGIFLLEVHFKKKIVNKSYYNMKHLISIGQYVLILLVFSCTQPTDPVVESVMETNALL